MTRPRNSHEVKGHERQKPEPPKPVAGALDRLASLAQHTAARAGFSRSPAQVRGLEMHREKGWQAVYRWPRGVVRITVQTGDVEVEALP